MTADELQKALDTAGSMTGDAVAFHRDIQSRALVSIVALLEAGAARAPGQAGKHHVQTLIEIKRQVLEVLAPFNRLMKANEQGGQKLKPEMEIVQVGAVTITGDDIKAAADLYDALWATR